jgi:hypothetical protein
MIPLPACRASEWQPTAKRGAKIPQEHDIMNRHNGRDDYEGVPFSKRLCIGNTPEARRFQVLIAKAFPGSKVSSQ